MWSILFGEPGMAVDLLDVSLWRLLSDEELSQGLVVGDSACTCLLGNVLLEVTRRALEVCITSIQIDCDALGGQFPLGFVLLLSTIDADDISCDCRGDCFNSGVFRTLKTSGLIVGKSSAIGLGTHRSLWTGFSCVPLLLGTSLGTGLEVNNFLLTACISVAFVLFLEDEGLFELVLLVTCK